MRGRSAEWKWYENCDPLWWVWVKEKQKRGFCYINSDFYTLWVYLSDAVISTLARSFCGHLFFHSYNSKGEKKSQFSNNFPMRFHSWQHRRCPWLLSRSASLITKVEQICFISLHAGICLSCWIDIFTEVFVTHPSAVSLKSNRAWLWWHAVIQCSKYKHKPQKCAFINACLDSVQLGSYQNCLSSLKSFSHMLLDRSHRVSFQSQVKKLKEPNFHVICLNTQYP